MSDEASVVIWKIRLINKKIINRFIVNKTISLTRTTTYLLVPKSSTVSHGHHQLNGDVGCVQNHST